MKLNTNLKNLLLVIFTTLILVHVLQVKNLGILTEMFTLEKKQLNT